MDYGKKNGSLGKYDASLGSTRDGEPKYVPCEGMGTKNSPLGKYDEGSLPADGFYKGPGREKGAPETGNKNGTLSKYGK